MNQLSGKVAAISGATGIVGTGIAIAFAREGAKISLIDCKGRSGGAELTARLTASGATASFIECDITDPGEAQRAIDESAEKYGRLDVLVNNNWVATPYASLLDKPESDFQSSMNACFFGTLRAMRAVVPHMRKVQGGRIINVSAPYGYTSYYNIADAVATDHALRGLTRVAGVEWGRYNITTNLLAPSLVNGPEFQQYRAQNPRAVDALIAQMPLRRLGDPVEDIGAAALYLASDEACYITGHTIFADGGQHINTAVFKPRPRAA